MNTLKTWDKINDILGETILHPQYFVVKPQKKILKIVLSKVKGKVLDIGCGRQLLKQPIINLNRGCAYIGLDHPGIYKRQRATSLPDILADVTQIPLPDSSCDSAILLMVLEHLPNPAKGLSEIYRVLHPNGLMFISTVENYPAHDLPDDHFRFRNSGLRAICKDNGFKIIKSYSFGNFWEINCVNFNVFLMQSAKLFLDKTRNIPATIIFVLLIYPLIFTSNLLTLVMRPFDFVNQSRLINFVIAQKK